MAVTRRIRTAAALYGLAAVVVALVVVLAVLLSWRGPWLVVCDGSDLRYAFIGGDGTRFALRWVHSVEQEDWIEQYQIHDNAIEVVATRFKTFGAGVPAHAGNATTLDNGWVVMHGIDRVVDPLAVQAASAEDYRMRYANDHWFKLSAPGSAPVLNIANVRMPLYRVAWALLRRWRVQP